MLIYLDKIPIKERDAFEEKVIEISSKLKANPDHLMQVMYSETAGTLRPDIENTKFPFADGFATGLIQFIPSTARDLGTTTQELKKMTRVGQLDYVYKYLKPYAGKLNSYFDVYLVVFYPAAVGNSGNDNYVFGVSEIRRAAIAKNNPAININKDEKITMAEFKQYLKNTVNKSFWDKVFSEIPVQSSTFSVIGFLFFGLIFYLIVK